MAIIIPQYDGRTNVYTYMGWQLVTDPSSKQYQLRQEAGQNFDSEGYGKITNCYVIACTTTFGQVGDYIDWTLSDGTILHTIVGDLKNQNDENANEWGHIYEDSISIVEFVVDYNTWYPSHANPGTATNHPEWAGQIQKADNKGNWFDGWRPGDTPITGSVLGLVTAVKYDLGIERACAYIASSVDGEYIYFNDNRNYRCYNDGSGLQIFYTPKQIWINSDNLYNIKVTGVNIEGILGDIGNINGGAGSSAPNDKVERAVQWGIDTATSRYITYSQTNRWGPNSYDCSSYVITMFRQGGFTINATYTGNMIAGFEAAGFVWHPAVNGTLPANILRRGDILLNIVHHTQVYIGNNQDVNCGSTPARVQSHVDYYSYLGANGWDGFLRYGV